MRSGRNGRAFEEGSTVRTGQLVENAAIAEPRAQGYIGIAQVQNNLRYGVDVIGRRPNGDVRCLEVKANTSRLEGDQTREGHDMLMTGYEGL